LYDRKALPLISVVVFIGRGSAKIYSGFESIFSSSYVATFGWKYTKTGKNAATLVFKSAGTDLSSSGGLIVTSLNTHTYDLNFTGTNKGNYQFTHVENSIVTDKSSGTFTLK
jgi:hypothetical protein